MQKKTWIIAALGALLLAGCHSGSEHQGEHGEAEPTEERHAHPGEIVMSPEKAKAAGVVAQEVKAGTFHGVIAVGGRILQAAGSEATAVATMSGRVHLLRDITEGMSVAKGGGLFSISADNLQDGDPTQHNRVAYETAKRELERAEKLIADKIITEREYNAARAAYEQARISYQAAGANRASGSQVTAPLTGYIKSCLVKEGDYVTVGQPLASVTQNRRLYLRADVPERYYDQLQGLTSAKFRLSYSDRVYDLGQLGGRLLAYGKSAQDASSYIPVTFEFDNSEGILAGAFAEIYLLTHERTGVVSLPTSAITEEQGAYFVYVQLDADCYRKHEVKLGSTDGDRVEITSGLKGGEKVVTQGAIHVKLAGASNAIPAHTHNH